MVAEQQAKGGEGQFTSFNLICIVQMRLKRLKREIALQYIFLQNENVLIVDPLFSSLFLPTFTTLVENSPNSCHGAKQQSISVAALVQTEGNESARIHPPFS